MKTPYHGIGKLTAWCKSGTRTSGPWDPGPPSKFKSGTLDPLKV